MASARDKSQAEVGSVVDDVTKQLEAARLGKEIIKAILEDLGDLEAEALRVTR